MTARAHPSVKTRSGSLEVTDDRVFGPSGGGLARRFARRLLQFEEVCSLTLDPARTTATVNYRLANGAPANLLTRLADALERSTADVNETELPHWTDGEPVILYRHAGIITIFEELNIANGCLTTRHPIMASSQVAARRIEKALRVVPGVIQAAVSEKLRLRFDPTAVSALQLIRIAEATVRVRQDESAASASEQPDLALANVSLGAAAVSDLILPPVMPISAGLLVLSNIGAFGAAATQLQRGEIGLPLLYASIVGVTLASGQYLPAALMVWFFRYWERRYRQELEVESRALLDACVGVPKKGRVLTTDGQEQLIPSWEISAGQRIRALAGETVPADAIVRSGAAVVDETALRGTSAPGPKVVGDPVLAGAKLVAGALDLEVLGTGHETRASRIAQTLTKTIQPLPSTWTLNRDAEMFAGRTVAPTLLAGGSGLLVGEITTAGAILRPDYASGIGLAVPLERLRSVKSAFRLGAVICDSAAFDRLATTSWIVLDEHEALHRSRCELAEIRTKQLADTRLLPAIAAAAVWLGDERGPALVRACRARELVVRRAKLREIDGDGVAVNYGDHVVRLRGRRVIPEVAPPPLIVEVDGAEAAGVRFRRNGTLEATTAIRQLQRAGVQVFLVSERPADAVAIFARRLGVNRHSGELRSDDKTRLLHALGQQGVASAYVGDGVVGASVGHQAHLSIALAGADADLLGPGHAEIVLVRSSIVPLPALFRLARGSVERMKRARLMAVAPNLLCVAGAFVFEFTAMASVIISNLGTSAVYNHAKRSLLEAERTSPAAVSDAEDDYAPYASESLRRRAA